MSKNRESVAGLIQCFDAFVENGFNVATAANSSYMHRNTIKKRLDKIYALTGFDPTDGIHGVLMNRLIFEEYMLMSRGTP